MERGREEWEIKSPCTAVAGEAGSPLKPSHYETHAASPGTAGLELCLCGLWDVSALCPSGNGMGLEWEGGASVLSI